MLDIAKTQPPVFKVWFGPNLCVFISNPHDLEIILSKCINRGDFFRFGSPLSRDGLLTSYRNLFEIKIKKKLIIINVFLSCDMGPSQESN